MSTSLYGTRTNNSQTSYISFCFNSHFSKVNLVSQLYEAKDDGSGGDSWSRKSCKAPAKSSPQQTNTQLFTN